MLGRLFLLFTLVPLAELYLLVTIGQLMGTGPTIALVADDPDVRKLWQ